MSSPASSSGPSGRGESSTPPSASSADTSGDGDRTSGSAGKAGASPLAGSSTSAAGDGSNVLLDTEGNPVPGSKANGSGPVDAALKAIEGVANSGANLLLYSVNAITQGTDSQGEVTVRLEKGGRIVNGSGADTDIVVASAKAYIHALNLLLTGAERQHPQSDGV